MASFPVNVSYKYNIASNPTANLQLFSNNKLIEMFNSVQYTLSTNTDIIESIPYFIEAVDKFQTNFKMYLNFSSEIKNNLISLFMQILNSLKKSGMISGNKKLKNLLSIDEFTLKNVPENILLSECRFLLKYSEDNNEICSEDELNINRIKEFSEKLRVYENLISLNLTHSNYSDHYCCISSLLKLLSNKIDALVNQLKNTHPNFYYEYRKARKYYFDTPLTIKN